MSDPVIVVGGGISGITAARELQRREQPVVVLDQGRRLGGRMASRTVDGRPVDIGASYFTASDPAFVAVVEDWERRGLAHQWTDTFFAYGPDGRASKTGPMRWGAPGGLRSLIEDLATGLEVRSQTVHEISPDLEVDGQPAAAVVLAMPDPQARRLFVDGAFPTVVAALDDQYEPVLALTAAWPARVWAELDGIFVQDDPVLSWVADDGRRRGDGAAVLVAHSTPELAADHLDEPDRALASMTAALRALLEITMEPTYASVHRWSFARPSAQRDAPFLLQDRLGICGDGWHGKSRVEGAFLSGAALGAELAAVLAGPSH